MSKSKEILLYSFASIAFYEYLESQVNSKNKYKGKLIGIAQNAQNVEINLTNEIIMQATGGELLYSSDAFIGNSSAEFSCELNEIIPSLYEYLYGGKITEGATAATQGTIVNVQGTSIISDTATVTIDDGTARNGTIILKAKSTAEVEAFDSRKNEVVKTFASTVTSIAVGGLTITRTAGGFVAGDETHIVVEKKASTDLEFIVNTENKAKDMSIVIEGVDYNNVEQRVELYRVFGGGQTSSRTSKETGKMPISGAKILATPSNEILRKIIKLK